MKGYFWGVLAMGTLVAAMFFFDYWRRTRDRLFGFFAAAFLLMAVQWTVSASLGTNEHPYLLLLRIAAFLCIFIGVMDRNRHHQAP